MASIITINRLHMLTIAETGPAGPITKASDIATIPIVSMKLPTKPSQKI